MEGTGTDASAVANGDARAWLARPAMREKKSEQSHSEVTAVTLPLIANSMMYM